MPATPTPEHFPTDDCRACGAAIIWARTVNGKAMPVDAQPSKNANVRLTFEGQGVRAHVVKATLAFGSTTNRLSHFVTCPKADEWRRKAGKSFDTTAAMRRIRGPR